MSSGRCCSRCVIVMCRKVAIAPNCWAQRHISQLDLDLLDLLANERRSALEKAIET